jgi:hypothetical protein
LGRWPYVTSVLLSVNGTDNYITGGKLWILVEKAKGLLRELILAARAVALIAAFGLLTDYIAAGVLACSACAGDYEDADAMAWTESQEEPDEKDQSVALDEFPGTLLAV